MQPPSLSRIRRPPTCRSMSPTQFRFYVDRVYRAYACSSKLPTHDSRILVQNSYFHECTLLCNIIRKRIDIGFHRDKFLTGNNDDPRRAQPTATSTSTTNMYYVTRTYVLLVGFARSKKSSPNQYRSMCEQIKRRCLGRKSGFSPYVCCVCACVSVYVYACMYGLVNVQTLRQE